MLISSKQSLTSTCYVWLTALFMASLGLICIALNDRFIFIHYSLFYFFPPFSESREQQFTTAVESIVMRGGSCLIPVFALGRAQELLLILDQYWQENMQLQVILFQLTLTISTASDHCLRFTIYRMFPSSTRQSSPRSRSECTRPLLT